MSVIENVPVNTFRNYLNILNDSSSKDELKLKATQELSEHFEMIMQSPAYPSFLDNSLKIFMRILQDGEPQFIQENTMQHIRKLILEMIHRLPITESLRQHVKTIITMMLKILKTDNEENVLVCLRIIIELHKHFRPSFNSEIQLFLGFVKEIYTNLPNHLTSIFETSNDVWVTDLKDLNLEVLLSESYSVRTIHVEKALDSNSQQQIYNLLPRGILSLKVLQELPIIVVLMYQIYKNAVHQEVSEFIPLILTTINLQPTVTRRNSPQKEIYVEFMGAQIKTLSFLAYIVRIFQEVVIASSLSVTSGMLNLMKNCPKEAAHLRKELLIAARHIFATDLRQKFIPSIEQLFDEDLLIGKGVTLDSIRPLAYSTLADLAHHVRQSLNIDVLIKAVNLFSKNVHDESLAVGIQTMSCKLLLNLVDCLRHHSETEPQRSKALLSKLLKVFVKKFETIAKIQLPLIIQKCKGHAFSGALVNSSGNASLSHINAPDLKDDISNIQVSASGSQWIYSVNVAEFRSLVKTLVGGVKTITWGFFNSKFQLTDTKLANHEKIFGPEIVCSYIDLVYYAMEALDIYTINVNPNQQRTSGLISRSKEEKEVLEHFSGIFLMMHSQNFQEIFSTTINFLVERIYKNQSLQVIANSFLANPTTSPLFATVLVEYLLNKMEEMGSNLERSNLYLRLFKLVFGSVSLFPVENEQMLRPHLHKIVNRSMELALISEEPYNYFLLLRALFRSIGGGSHDLLYQEFLPLLPNLLEGLNRLQSGFHKQHMRDLFVELCLTVPVRLSSLLPYLPMLMDPLVSALNGSPTLISQGLRTLELCVDNLQPDFLYDHIQPVRAALMQALWKTLRNQDNAALVAFRVLGKFGGGNRKMMVEPQALSYIINDKPTISIVTYFQEYETPIDFPVDEAIKSAFRALGSNSTDQFYRRQSWEVIRCFLAAFISLDDEKHMLLKLFTHVDFVENKIMNWSTFQHKAGNETVRETHQTALIGMLVASATKDLRDSVCPVMAAVVRHYTMVAIAQQAGPFPQKGYQATHGIDPMILIDALASCMGHEEKELCKPGIACMGIILDTATNIMGNKDRACKLPIIQYLAEKMVSLCYDRPWYSKVGGCQAIQFLCKHMSLRALFQNLFNFLKAFMFVLMDLEGDVSNGAIEITKSYMKSMLEICLTPINECYKNIDLKDLQAKATYEVIHELVRHITSPNTIVREESMVLLKHIGTIQSKTVSEVMDPHKDVLADIIPPKKHLLRHQPANAQIGLMDGNTFCTTLEPRLFTIDLTNTYHKLFFHELLTLSEAEDATLAKLDCYKNVPNLIPLRTSALRALAACHYISDIGYKEKIINIIFKVMESDKSELQTTAFHCMKHFITGVTLEKEKVQSAMRPLLLKLGDHRNLSIPAIKRLSYFTQIFPQMFNEKLSEQILQHCSKIMEIFVSEYKSTSPNVNFFASSKGGEYEQKIVILIEMFFYISASVKYIEKLCQLVLKTEKNLMIEASSPYREALIKFLQRFPTETVDLFLTESLMIDPQWNRLFIYLLKHETGVSFRAVIKSSRYNNLIHYLNTHTEFPEALKYEIQHQAVLIIFTLMESDDQWIPTRQDIVDALKNCWQNYLSTLSSEDVLCDLWHLIGKILLHYFSNNTNDIELLFQLLRALCFRFIPDVYFLRDFLQHTVAQSFTVNWKRNAFFYFVENFNNSFLSEELKAKIITAVIIPCFAVSFDKGEGNKLIGAPPTPYQEDEKNIVSVFINKVFDPDKQYDDAVRIALLQLACLLVERASQHIHDGDANNKRQGNKLRRLMTFAWPCLLSKSSVDPTARYHGHLLLSHIIARLAIHKKIVLQVFHSLLKGHALEARSIVKQALDVLTPAMPLRMEDGNTMLTHWTKKIIVEEGHAMQQLFHILQLIIRHYKVYFPVRHQLVQHLINYMQRLGFPPTASIEHKKLAVDLAEVIIKWELHRIKDDRETKTDGTEEELIQESSVKRSGIDLVETRKKSFDIIRETTVQGVGSHTKPDDILRSIDKSYCDTVLNFLIRLACQVNDPQAPILSPGESLSRRCVMLLKMAMRPEIWPQPFDIKLNWLDKVLATVETPHHNLNNICTGIDFLTFLTTILSPDQLVSIIRPVQRGLSLCIIHQNTRIVRLMHMFLTRIMAIFPPDTQHKHEDLDLLYTAVSKMIAENLTSYEKSPQPNASSLFGTLMILKACTTNNASYIDRILVQFIRVLNHLTRDHINTIGGNTVISQSPDSNALPLELLVLSLELIKNRIFVMSVEIRKLFIGTILVSLIEKSTEVKIIKCIIKMLDEWIKTKEPNVMTQVPSIREKSALLVKLMQNVEKKFTDEIELNIQFLEIINFIYRDEILKQTELTNKLEGAFLNGLRFQNPNVRSKFFEILDSSMRRRLHDRLLYIICSQAWDTIGSHYWIKQCIELLILTANTMMQIQCSNEQFKIPSITSVIPVNSSETQENSFVSFLSSHSESFDIIQTVDDKDDVYDIDLNADRKEDCQQILPNRRVTLVELVYKQAEFLEANRNIRTDQMLVATSQLCHIDTQLAQSVWLSMFPRIWSIFTEDQRCNITKELIPFLSSGTNVNQKDCHPSTLNTFVESLTKCAPPIYIPPNLLAYLGKSHNLWHRAILVLEDMAVNQSMQSKDIDGGENQFSDLDVQQSNNIFDSLSKMYSSMHEEDLWAGLWLKFAHYPETNIAVSYEQMGFFEEAQGAYDLAMTKFKQDLSNGVVNTYVNSELLLWENHWMRCAKELNQWDILLDYAQTNKDKNMFLILESSWRVPDWNLMKIALAKTEQCYLKHYGFKINLYKGYLSILHQEERQTGNIERYVEIASSLCIREWRRLPNIVSHIHLPYLQASQQIMELHEASQIHQGLAQSRNNSLHDMKAIVKTWRNRLPIISDDLSHWSDIFTWRQHHYQIITQHLEQQSDQGSTMLGVHASAQAIISFGKIARKHNLTGVCQETLSRIYTIPSVPIVDCFQKIRQQVKCYLQMPSTSGKNEINEALEVIESTNLKYFTGEMNAEFYALKGLLLAQIGRSEEAGKSFSVAAQLHDGLTKAWAMWGDYMEQIFLKERKITLAVDALICYLQASRNQIESKTRKYIAKVLWFLSYDNNTKILISTLEKHVAGIPPSYWLPWIPQLLCCLEQFEGDVILNLLSQIGRLYPQAVYFPIRTLYLTLKIEQREKHKTAEQAVKSSCSNIDGTTLSFGRGASHGNIPSINPIKATPPMWRCSKVMQLQREVHPTILSSLEGIVDQMVWFRESWTEEVLRQLRQGLIKCYAIAFEKRDTVQHSTITPHTLHFVKKLGSTFGIGIENVPGSVTSSISNSAASESLARRAQVTFQDPVFQKMKEQFTNDFDFSKPGAMKLHNLISKLKTWIKVLETKVKKLPTSFLIEDKCRFLSNFSQKTAEVELPGELLIPLSSHYYVRIARFMPRVEIVQKNNTAARRLYIRGTNGKIYPYLVVLDSGLGDARREERVLQLKRMLNYYLEKQKETSRRFLNITVPRVVPISPQMRLAEDNPNSISLLKIFKKCCQSMQVDYDMPIVKYYDRLSEVQARGTPTTHTLLREIFSEIQWTMVPKTLLKHWALKTFLAATDFWHFRKMLTLQLALAFLCEHALNLTRLNADMMYLHQDSGLMNISYFKFDVNDDKCQLNQHRPVPFRLTPNVGEFITHFGITGPLSAAIVATARCFIQPNYKLSSILQTILRDEIIALQKKGFRECKLIEGSEDRYSDGNCMEHSVNIVNSAVDIIMTRFNKISYFDSIENKKISVLVQSATNIDNLCRMDPAWHPWL
uniref:Transcription-associated protein 1 n=1 Tax=Drosophila melanogaster TaxID=7227 RepID=TRA1_DROME|nr:Nipped-A, isoform E [Drosophila melanogaster]Q8I8U7.4 RecName: Full=Transcription-associated protein 1; AltName: Full=dTRA1 [Drosophila melanogaster]ABD22987.1 Nipped-A [Drosophila melanogaster]ABV53702.2 Nipped-A, isoform E [Drosophila melanogaster]|eukprot:NP_001097192.2 Nipped-A, isoform E [Drosophila melanogaster]